MRDSHPEPPRRNHRPTRGGLSRRRRDHQSGGGPGTGSHYRPRHHPLLRPGGSHGGPGSLRFRHWRHPSGRYPPRNHPGNPGAKPWLMPTQPAPRSGRQQSDLRLHGPRALRGLTQRRGGGGLSPASRRTPLAAKGVPGLGEPRCAGLSGDLPAADQRPPLLQRLREEQQVREALRVLRQAGETPGSCRRHRSDPPPLDPSEHQSEPNRAPFLSPPEPMAALAAAAMLPERPPLPP
jgi:hypothetical protein